MSSTTARTPAWRATLLLVAGSLVPSPVLAAEPLPGLKKNGLAGQRSPYLRQHADDPVDWQPWGDEAFARAKREDKPVFLSIGYSTCHWCHVMERETFQDDEAARTLNAAFVCVKVDREERPDVDQVYMLACQAMTGRGGWPLTVLLTHDRKPFFAGSYFPKTSGRRGTGVMELTARVQAMWRDERSALLKNGDAVTTVLGRIAAPRGGVALDEASLAAGTTDLKERYDATHGGFAAPPRFAPKFPTPHNVLFLLRRHFRTGDPALLAMSERTLAAWRAGGVRDHLGGGFHRYAVDAAWRVPHFEKMLYDQALIALACVEAWQATGREEHRALAQETLAYVRRELATPEGALRAAEDADSEGEEGVYYLWTAAQFDELLTADESSLAKALYGATVAGNFDDPLTGGPTGQNVLRLERTLPEAVVAAFPADRRPDEASAAAIFDVARRKLSAARQRRVRPRLDDKILVDWNGLAIAALAKAGGAWDDPDLIAAAERAADFVRTRMRDPDGRLLHRWHSGEAGLPATLEDHAFFAWGLIELYEATGDPARLRQAVETCEQMIRRYDDAATGGFFFAPADGESLIVRLQDVHDGATPSGNSVALDVLARLARLTGRDDFEERADRLVRAYAGTVAEDPATHAHFLAGVDRLILPAAEIVVAGPRDAAETRALARVARRAWRPDAIRVLRPTDEPAATDLLRLAPWTKGLTPAAGRSAAFVCRDRACDLPVSDADVLETKLRDVPRADPPFTPPKPVEPDPAPPTEAKAPDAK